jgi:N-acylneuraminate cytidylyltransferase
MPPNPMAPSSSVLAVIPARGGSKGLPRKNVRLLGGKPLIAHTVTCALQAGSVQRVVVSTDDDEIGLIARQHGAEVIERPAALSGDTASSESALLHALDHLGGGAGYEPELVVFLQCTAPLRKPEDIDRAVAHLRETGADSLLTVAPSHRFLWRLEGGDFRPINYDYRQRPRRQDRAPEYVENGSFYVFRPWVLRQLNNRLGGKITFYEMGAWSSLDIDSEGDFALAELILSLPADRPRFC